MTHAPLAISDPQALAAAALFYTFAGLTLASALYVVVSRNIVRTALALLFTLTGVAGLYFLLHAEFLAAVQLVVYAGGTLILIIFGVMLTTKDPRISFRASRLEVSLAVLVSVTLLITLVTGIVSLPHPVTPPDSNAAYPMAALGSALLGDYLIPFELSSVLLLVVMIGAAHLAKSTRVTSNK